MVTGKLLAGNGDLAEVMNIRVKVFTEELGCPAPEQDEYDARAVHALLYDDDHDPAATGRLYIDDEGYWRLSRIAVRKEKRGQQLGDLVMRMLLDKAIGVGAQQFKLSTPESAVGFCALYGFAKAEQQNGADVEMEATVESIVRAVFSGCRGENFL